MNGAVRVMCGLLLVSPIVAGCAKKPATAGGAIGAPPPTISRPMPTPGPMQAAPTPAPAPRGGPTTSTTQAAPTAPAPVMPQRVAPAEFTTSKDLVSVHFDFDKSDIKPEAARILDGNAAWLKRNTRHLVLIEGHCDERGTGDYNLALGDRRANSTKDYLVAQGVQASRITTVSFGKERPLCTENTEPCYARNRRADFLVRAQ